MTVVVIVTMLIVIKLTLASSHLTLGTLIYEFLMVFIYLIFPHFTDEQNGMKKFKQFSQSQGWLRSRFLHQVATPPEGGSICSPRTFPQTFPHGCHCKSKCCLILVDSGAKPTPGTSA